MERKGNDKKSVDRYENAKMPSDSISYFESITLHGVKTVDKNELIVTSYQIRNNKPKKLNKFFWLNGDNDLKTVIAIIDSII